MENAVSWRTQKSKGLATACDCSPNIKSKKEKYAILGAVQFVLFFSTV